MMRCGIPNCDIEPAYRFKPLGSRDNPYRYVCAKHFKFIANLDMIWAKAMEPITTNASTSEHKAD